MVGSISAILSCQIYIPPTPMASGKSEGSFREQQLVVVPMDMIVCFRNRTDRKVTVR